MELLPKTPGLALYAQVREALRAQIENGELKPGQQLPPEPDLATQFGISRMTVRRGIAALINEGLLYRRRGIGTFVTQFHIERDHNKLSSFFETSQELGADATIQFLEREIVPAEQEIAEALKVAFHEPLVHIRTLRLVGDVPVALHDEYIPHKLCPELMDEEIIDQHSWEVLDKHGYAIKLAIQKNHARGATTEVAELLEMEEGSPLLFKHRTIFAEDGTPVVFMVCHNRGDMYSLKMKLVR
ncbi:MAG: GntR family transcriptional regulator [Anaerolineae bacterium]|nr:GntR family transcriptional regulator [Anaerolineae bacterium]